MRATLIQKLESIESECNVHIIYAVESGSRAWGFASPDSDYDVRFIYLRSPAEYLSVFPRKDVIDPAVEGLLDFGGWDARKAFGLLRKSNCALLEWLRSPIVYRQTPMIEPMRSLMPVAFRAKASFTHYAALARGKWKDISATPQPKVKHYCYALRAVLCCRYIVKHGAPPPVPIRELLELTLQNAAPRADIDRLLEMKSQMGETAVVARIHAIDDFIQQTWALYAEISEASEAATEQTFNAAFLQTLALQWGAQWDLGGTC